MILQLNLNLIMFGCKNLYRLSQMSILQRGLLMNRIPLFNNRFSTNKQNQPQNQKSGSPNNQDGGNPQQNNENRGQKQKNLDRIFNVRFGLPEDYSFGKQLIVSQSKYKKSLRDLKQAILFEDLLKSEIDIPIYDTKGKPYNWQILKALFGVFMGITSLVSLQYLIENDPQINIFFEQMGQGALLKVILYAVMFIFMFKTVIKYARVHRRNVEKIIYNTETQNFTFVRRTFWGGRYSEQISRYKLLYTENSQLNKVGTNYLHIDNKSQYFIGFNFAWKKQDLFSHLISQRIRK